MYGHQCLFIYERTSHDSVTAVGSLQSTCDWIQYPCPGNEVLITPSTTHSVEGLDLNDKTIEKHPQRDTELSCMTIETNEPNSEGGSLHFLAVQPPRTPSVVRQPRQEIETLPLQ